MDSGLIGINDEKIKFTRTNRLIDKLGCIKQYFTRGHQFWFTFLFSIGSFTLLFYNFIVVEWTFIPSWLKNFGIFFVVFFACYFVLASLVGWLDYQRGTFYSQEYLLGKNSPIWQSAFKRFNEINEKLDKLMEKLGDEELSD